MSNEVKSVLLAVGVPFAGVLGGIVYLSDSEFTVLGFPVLFAWLFLWMPLTSLCMHLAWCLFDRADFEELERADLAADRAARESGAEAA
ncbi:MULTISPECIES: DUF3311 domain-containing protein [Tsukamurella]|uniref:DUF3311 domain-containing protein n=2 Tax=Tsukamurella TaxID=2060 RepID=A0A5C5S045_9ACTN|nr:MULTISPECIES: DUF3311 domain-containing protein [Tsukamurella]NMD55503.1 DUF3311 domain-containing protein [Tsukamurella columbiensis]TWS28068.1 DUF3311 domain-containing protein [Tsukamurella conjunctivitidis]